MHAPVTESHLSPMLEAWNRFWFMPSDPTVLGAIRILTGLITFYTLLAYSIDLQELMGENAWLDLQLRQEQYRQAPVPKVPLDWSDPTYGPPTTDAEKEYFKEYVRRWNMPPPLPYPKDLREAQRFDDYRARWGVDSRIVMAKGRPVWSIWFHVTDPFWMSVVHGGIVVCSFLFLIGCGTRVTSALTWFGALSFIHRSPPSLFGADTMMAVLLLYLMIGPSGAALSVDRLIARWWAKRQGLQLPTLTPSVSANLALRLIQVHVCIIYVAAGLAKLQGTTWWTGIAPWGTLANYEYAPMQVPLYVSFLHWLAQSRWFFEAMMTVGALGTLTFEIGYPFLIWRPAFRKLWLWIAVLLHAGIGMFMGLRTFSLLMLAFNLAFVSPETIRWVLGKLSPKTWQSVDAAAEAPAPAPERPTAAALRQDKPVKTVAVKRKR
jgi:hypothetical protein